MKDIEEFFSARGFRHTTQEGYRYILSSLDQYLEKHQLAVKSTTPEIVMQWMDSNPQWHENMRYKAYATTRSYFRWKFGTRHPVLTMHMKRPSYMPQRTLTRPQLIKLLDAIPVDTFTGIRNYALVSLLVDTGLRKSEVCKLKLKNVDIDQRILWAEIKGGTWGWGIFSPETADYLLDWLSIRKDIAAPGVDTFFTSVGGQKPGTQITPDGMTCIFKQLGIQAGMRVSPHDLRRTFATLMTIDQAPTELVRKAGRWVSDGMVKVYAQAVPVTAISPFLVMSNLHQKVDGQN